MSVYRCVWAWLCVLAMAGGVCAGEGDSEAGWKHQIVFPDDPFQSWTSPAYVKFTIVLADGFDPNVVWYQDSKQYEYHYDFARAHLAPFAGMTIERFDAATLHAEGQQAILGAVIFPPWADPPLHEYGIQLVRQDAYAREEVVELFGRVRASVMADPNVTAYYFPTYEQYPVAQQHREWLGGQGVPVGSTARWSQGNASYSKGWALGTLTFVEGSDLQGAYTRGDLRSGDILLTDGVPSEVPSVAGIVSLMPATPNSHVAILARSQGVPFVHLAVTADVAAARGLVGRTVYLSVGEGGFGSDSEIELLDAEALSTEDRASLLALKESPPLAIVPMVHQGRFWADTSELGPGDIAGFGGKAANFGVLRDAVPEDSPRAMAFSFDLWNAFLDRPMFGTTLRAEIAERLSEHSTYPPADMASLAADLATVREWFTDADISSFGDELETVVLEALSDFGFDPGVKIRFRSSTNVEDSDRFTGAGLYDSYSGCLADDLDGDSSGPCACDASEGKERGVFRAIRKVFASFYNDNAFLEQLKHGIDETQVGMALLVHPSFPDEIELANGVVTMERNWSGDWDVEIVCQKGAVSVTNPPADAVPETVQVSATPMGAMPWVMQRSSLVSLREYTVLAWESDYVALYELVVTAAERYCEVKGAGSPVLDLEFKKTTPAGQLVLKQIREIPKVSEGEYATPFLLGAPREYRTLQGRGSNVFTNHRLKSRWTVTPASAWLDDDRLRVCLYDEVKVEYVLDGRVREMAGSPAMLPGAEHVYEGPQWDFDSYDLVDRWRLDDPCNPRTVGLRTTPMFQATVPDPVVTLDDFRLALEVEYEQPLPVGEDAVTTAEEAMLYRPWQAGADDWLEACAFDDPNTGVSIRAEFYMRWSWDPSSPTSIQMERTRIEGLTDEPIVLTGYFSQSVGGGSHLCPKNFLFEPRLEKGISQAILDELAAKGIRLIYFTTGARECRPTEWEDTPPAIRLYGFE
jgi:hypothetical protein